MTPACADCGRTSFRPSEPGRYNVTVIVTDSEGRSSTDTLYVYVKDFGPTVRLDGDTDPQAGERAPYKATVEANGFDLEELTWRVNGDTVASESLSGAEADREQSFSFSSSRTHRLTAVAEDSTGRSARASIVVAPRSVGRVGSQSVDVDRSDSGSSDDYPDSTGCKNGIYVEGDAGCIGPISDPSHTNQDEGCEEAFCGAENPANQVSYIDSSSDSGGSDEDTGTGYRSKADDAISTSTTTSGSAAGYLMP
jgi:hypothetical protein